jgi:hypothetical protein
MRGYKLLVPSDCVAANSAKETEYSLLQMKNVLKADIRESIQVDLESFKPANRGDCGSAPASSIPEF